MDGLSKMLIATTFRIALDVENNLLFDTTFFNMEGYTQQPIQNSYPVLVRFNQEFLKDVISLKNVNHGEKHLFHTKNPIWEYIPTTTLRLYWLNKRTDLYNTVEIRWQKYIRQNIIYPSSSFPEYLMINNPDRTLDRETADRWIKTWFEVRNNIYQ